MEGGWAGSLYRTRSHKKAALYYFGNGEMPSASQCAAGNATDDQAPHLFSPALSEASHDASLI
jgi:hypothetical protein